MANTGGPTRATEAAMLDAAIGGTLYLGLFTTLPTADDGTGGTEASGTGYGRVSIAVGDWAAAVAGSGTTPTVKKVSASKSFAQAGASWGNVKGWGLWSLVSGGTLSWVGTLDTAKDVASGDTPSFAANAIRIALGNPDDAFSGV